MGQLHVHKKIFARVKETDRKRMEVRRGTANLYSKSKWMLTGVSTILAVSILLPTASANKLNELEQKQQKIEQKQNDLNYGIVEKKNELTENQSTLEKIMGKIQELESKIQETEGKITSVQNDIDITKDEIEILKESIVELERKIAEREELLRERARAIQLSGGSVDYIDVLLGANSFIDFIDRFSAVNTLMEADREIMREQALDKDLLADQKEQVEAKLAEQETLRAELVSLKKSLDGQKAEQNGLVKELKAEQKRLAKEKAELEQQREDAIEVSAELEKQIAAEQERLAELARKAEEERQRKIAAEAERQRKIAAEKKAQEERAAAAERAAAEKASASNKKSAPTSSKPSSTTVSSPKPVYSAPAKTSAFINPTVGRYTSKFGWRNIGAGPEFHQGVDIANIVGTNVVSAAPGFVSYAGTMGGYGNVVIVTHSINGQTHATVYAHLDSIGVSVSQSVSQGQSVGKMGNTGRSFGSHLHFEIHVGPWNGSRSNAVNPANYISF